MDRFYAGWKDGIRAKAKKLDRLRSFARFCLKRTWLTENVAEDLHAPQGSSVPANKSPFTEEEPKGIYEACDKFGPSAVPGDPLQVEMYTVAGPSWIHSPGREFRPRSEYVGCPL